jgi:hypothetical protein
LIAGYAIQPSLGDKVINHGRGTENKEADEQEQVQRQQRYRYTYHDSDNPPQRRSWFRHLPTISSPTSQNPQHV